MVGDLHRKWGKVKAAANNESVDICGIKGRMKVAHSQWSICKCMTVHVSLYFNMAGRDALSYTSTPSLTGQDRGKLKVSRRCG